ncbi:hypothetical protein JN531_003760 [Flagellatimonas centrodinii]|uniref:hypothetical protein n=1 Tax=Flagellatimonas centrodinii TaxID=2806210 RepID=UPI001FF03F68|nr:hypothetical protein [Flagellatimonas centrodinii]ULQ47403.1 hypothetical protein JN531_003760 [Flagellatimonas centrodinii]
MHFGNEDDDDRNLDLIEDDDGGGDTDDDDLDRPGPDEDRGDVVDGDEGEDGDEGDGGNAEDLDAEALAALATEGDDTQGAGDGGDRSSGAYIPRARFNDVNTRRQAAEEEAARLRAELEAERAGAAGGQSADVKAAEAAAPPPEPVDLKGLRKQRNDALLEGDVDKATEIEEQIDAEVERRADARANAAWQKREEEQAAAAAERARKAAEVELATEAAAVIADYPELDAGSDDAPNPKADMDLISEVVALRDSYIRRGTKPGEALRKAADRLCKKPDPADDDDGKAGGDSLSPEQRRQQILQRNAQHRQPPSVAGAGVGGRAAAAKLNVEAMSEDEFESLPEAEKARLRGDSV